MGKISTNRRKKISARGGSPPALTSQGDVGRGAFGGKILVAMSGGVDSSVAAALLVKAGYDVTGAFMVNYKTQMDNNIGDKTQMDNNIGTDHRGDACLQGEAPRSGAESCWAGDYRDALRVAAKLGIPLLRLDFTKEYRRDVLDYMYKEYEAGRTPNPDVLCNKFVKFGHWLDWAKKHGFDFLATGHYARLRREILNPKPALPAGRSEIRNKSKNQKLKIKLLCAKDGNKDQTYFLHQLSQEQLKHVLFPIGDYTKPEVRKLAKEFDLPTADKEESMGICFVGEVKMKEFLQARIPRKKGKIILSDGTVMGVHEGVAFYTIGERIGVKFPISPDASVGIPTPTGRRDNFQSNPKSKYQNSKPFFVVDKKIKTNELVVGFVDDPLLYKKEIEAGEVNWIGGKPPKLPLKCEVRLRHRQPLQKCAVYGSQFTVKVKFDEPQRAVTPGQFAVFYKNGICLGGGVIAAD